MALYRCASETDIYPGALVAESGVIDCAAATGKKSFAPNAACAPNEIVWLMMEFGTLAATIRGPPVAACNTDLIGTDDALGANGGVGVRLARAFGAYPATFTAGATVNYTTTIPAIWARFSA